MVRPVSLLGMLFGLGALAVLAMFFVEHVYLPQRNLIEEQRGTIAYLSHELQSIRSGLQEKAGQSRLELRVALLEKFMRRNDADAAKELDQLLLPAAGSSEAATAARNSTLARGADGTAAQASPATKSDEVKTGEKKTKNKKPKIEWRNDDKCGLKTPGQEGQMIGCNSDGKFPCCSPAGWCGDSARHCSCDGCIDYRREQETAGQEEEYDMSKPKSIALVVPFRDRGTHLDKFRERIEELVESWNQKDIQHYWMVFVVEQFDNELFNRGWLFNVGFKYALEIAKEKSMSFDCVVMHDVDILPTPVVDYGWCIYPNQLSGEIECWHNSVPYQDSTGGVISMSPEHWTQINGFSNEYQGWGGEDDDLYCRLKQNSLLRGGCHTFCKEKNRIPMVVRPKLGEGRFTCLNDGDHTPRQRHSNDAAMWSRLNAMKAGSPRWRTDGVSSVATYAAGPALESEACTAECVAPEDPTPRKRRFAEHWSRVSLKPIAEVSRIHIVLPDGHASGNCSENATSALGTYPVGLAHLRRLLPQTFGDPSCNVDAFWAAASNFVLLDTTNGMSIMVGSNAPVVRADRSVAPSTMADPEGKWTYRRGKDGDSRCAPGTNALTEDECREMPTHFSGIFAEVIDKEEDPPGCYFCSVCETGRIIFNRNPLGRSRSGRSPICKEPRQEVVEKEYVVQGQRLGRWLRRLPPSHHGWIMVTSETLPDLHERIVQTGNRHAQTVPVCMATADFDGRKKYRVSPGSVWCGDGGWSSQDHFQVLRSKSSVPKEQLVPICVSTNKDQNLFRFEKSTVGCVGVHKQTNTRWEHVTTLHTMKDAKGEKMCIGVLIYGSRSHWMIKKASDCTRDGFQHTFSFRAMVNKFEPAFVQTCLQRSPSDSLRLVAGDACKSLQKAADGYAFVRDVITLSRWQNESVALCTSEGEISKQAPGSPKVERIWRLFQNDACSEKERTTQEAAKDGEVKVRWLRTSGVFYLPKNATGAKFCICRRASEKYTAVEVLHFVLSVETCTGEFEIMEFCFNTLSATEAIQASFFVDEPV